MNGTGAVRDAAARLLATTVHDVEQVPSFAGNRVFAVRTSTHRYFLKYAPCAGVDVESRVLRLVHGLGIPAPVVTAVDLDGTVAGGPCLATRAVDGQPLKGHEPVFDHVAPILQRLHRVHVDGFGSLRPGDDGGVRGEDDTWLTTLRRRTEAARAVVDAGLVPEPLVDAVRHAVDAYPWGECDEPRLLHGDFHPRHVYADRGRITALIDWGDATAGDPDYDLARVLHSTLLRADMPTAMAIVARIASRGAPIDGPRLSRLLTYAAVFIVWSMHGEHAGGAPWPPWWPIQTRALEQILAALADTR